jgi:uncharacterized protein
MPLPADLARQTRRAGSVRLRSLGRTLVAYSGGVDSAFLAWAAYQALGDGMLAVIADSPSLARAQLADAVAFAREQEIPLEVISTSELERPEYVRNDSNRCFFCKDELFTVMEKFRRERGFDSIAYGVNVDDQGDFRPGPRRREGARCCRPVAGGGPDEAGNPRPRPRPPACAFGTSRPRPAYLRASSTAVRLQSRSSQRGRARRGRAARALGFRQFRVRHHGEIVRIEVAREELPRALNLEIAAEFSRIFKALGFKFVTLDLEGFRSGSMNALLPAEQLARRR